MLVLVFIVGAGLGALVMWVIARARAAAAVAVLQAALAREQEVAAERVAAFEAAGRQLENAFKALSSDALRTNNESFLQLARAQLEQLQVRATGDLERRQKAVEELVAPIRESLERVDRQVRTIEETRREAHGSLVQQLQSLGESQERLRAETNTLATALRAPHVRGRWGELQLKRVVELAGMIAYCDFVEQAHSTDDEGRLLRPDVVVRLPGGKNIVVDAKAPLSAYLDGIDADDDDVRRVHLQNHARLVRDHVTKLGAKGYWRQFAPAPDFVVMFLPDEAFLRAALEHDAALIEAGVEAGVVLATPTTLIALLRAVAYGWQQDTIAENAKTISSLGRELYDRVGTLARHFAKLGRSLDGAVGAYNEAIGSLESRVLVTARKFEAQGIATPGSIGGVAPLERQPRPLQAVELARAADEDSTELAPAEPNAA
jgi:DNA recombination protein RmuC